MSGALQDTKTDEDAQPNATLPSSPFHVPGRFPDSPVRFPPTPTPISPPSDALASSQFLCGWWTSEVVTWMKVGVEKLYREPERLLAEALGRI